MFVMLFSFFSSLLGCQSSREKAEEVIEAALFEKYGEEFVVDYIRDGYAGTMNSNILRGIARPKSDPSIRVKFEITKDLERVYDDYLSEMVARNAVDRVETLAQSIWPDSRVDVAIDTKSLYPNHTDLMMSYEEFLQHYPSPITTLLIGVFLNGEDYIDQEGNMDQEGELAKYLAFAELLADHKYLSSRIGIAYLSPEANERFDEAKNADVNVEIYYEEIIDKEKQPIYITRVGYGLSEDGEIKESREEIYRFFDIWKEKRNVFRQKRGGS